MKIMSRGKTLALSATVITCAVALTTWGVAQGTHRNPRNIQQQNSRPVVSKDPIVINAAQLITQGRQIFRFDTYGDEAFWGDTLQLHQAIEGSHFGGVGDG